MNKNFKKVIKETTETKVDYNTGEITETTSKKEYKIPKEPDFVKLYIDDICDLIDLPNNDVLFCLLKKTNYDGEVTIIKPIAEQICKLANLKNVEYFYKLVKKYCEKNILIKKCRGLYVFNPYYFARGGWEDIYRVRLEINYTPGEGRKINVVQFDKKFEEDKNEQYGVGMLPYLDSLDKSEADKIIYKM